MEKQNGGERRDIQSENEEEGTFITPKTSRRKRRSTTKSSQKSRTPSGQVVISNSVKDIRNFFLAGQSDSISGDVSVHSSMNPLVTEREDSQDLHVRAGHVRISHGGRSHGCSVKNKSSVNASTHGKQSTVVTQLSNRFAQLANYNLSDQSESVNEESCDETDGHSVK